MQDVFLKFFPDEAALAKWFAQHDRWKPPRCQAESRPTCGAASNLLLTWCDHASPLQCEKGQSGASVFTVVHFPELQLKFCFWFLFGVSYLGGIDAWRPCV